MSWSPIINTLLVYAILIASTALSAPREELISQRPTKGELHKTREAELLEQTSKRLRNERFDVSQEDELVHRPARVVNGTPLESNERGNQTLEIKDPSIAHNLKNHANLGADGPEIKDMIESNITLTDDRGDPTDHEPLPTTNKGRASEQKSSAANASANTVLPPEIFPEDDKSVIIKMVSPEWLEQLKRAHYKMEEAKVNSTDGKTEKPTEVLVVPISSKPEVSTSDGQAHAGTTATAPTTAGTTSAAAIAAATTTPAPTAIPTNPGTAKLVPTVAPTTSHMTEWTSMMPDPTKVTSDSTSMWTTDRVTPSSPSPAEMKLHEKKKPVPTSMPTSVVTLITAIAFAMVGIVIYMGLLFRRRYFEWRYGNRELLVNDFDAADISNFEL